MLSWCTAYSSGLRKIRLCRFLRSHDAVLGRYRSAAGSVSQPTSRLSMLLERRTTTISGDCKNRSSRFVSFSFRRSITVLKGVASFIFFVWGMRLYWRWKQFAQEVSHACFAYTKLLLQKHLNSFPKWQEGNALWPPICAQQWHSSPTIIMLRLSIFWNLALSFTYSKVGSVQNFPFCSSARTSNSMKFIQDVSPNASEMFPANIRNQPEKKIDPILLTSRAFIS